MNRRDFLKYLAANGLFYIFSNTPQAFSKSYVTQPTAIPIVMFHRVNDTPRFPEEISSKQLQAFFMYIWSMGYYPINIKTIIQGKVDKVLPVGFKPVGITIDDAHPSVFFSKKDVRTIPFYNEFSFMDIFLSTCHEFKYKPQVTIFLSSYRGAEKSAYFGSVRPLKTLFEQMDEYPGIEFGYHTHTHVKMRGMDYKQTKALLQKQMYVFEKEGVVSKVTPIIAYPYGLPPTQEGIKGLKDLGFIGGVLAFPGINEGRYVTLPQCFYDKKLLIDSFSIPRVNIGSYVYPPGDIKSKNFIPIEPIDSFHKDFECQIVPYMRRK